MEMLKKHAFLVTGIACIILACVFFCLSFYQTHNDDYRALQGRQQLDTAIANTYYSQGILPYSVIKTICADKGGVDNCVLLLFDANVVQKIYSALKHKGLYFGARRIIYDNFEYIPEHDITSKAYALKCTFHKSEEYSYQNEFRISVLNTQDAPITDLYIDVSPDDFNVLELKENHDLCCSVELEITHTGCNHATLGIHSTYELMPCRDTSFDAL